MSDIEAAKNAALRELDERRRADGTAIDTHVAGSRAIVSDRAEALRELVRGSEAPPAPADEIPAFDESSDFDFRIDTQA